MWLAGVIYYHKRLKIMYMKMSVLFHIENSSTFSEGHRKSMWSNEKKVTSKWRGNKKDWAKNKGTVKNFLWRFRNTTSATPATPDGLVWDPLVPLRNWAEEVRFSEKHHGKIKSRWLKGNAGNPRSRASLPAVLLQFQLSFWGLPRTEVWKRIELGVLLLSGSCYHSSNISNISLVSFQLTSSLHHPTQFPFNVGPLLIVFIIKE